MLFFERAAWDEQAFLVHPQFKKNSKTNTPLGQDMEEFRMLCLSAGVDIVGEEVCVRQVPDPKYFIGHGKADEIALKIKEWEFILDHFSFLLVFREPAQEPVLLTAD